MKFRHQIRDQHPLLLEITQFKEFIRATFSNSYISKRINFSPFLSVPIADVIFSDYHETCVVHSFKSALSNALIAEPPVATASPLPRVKVGLSSRKPLETPTFNSRISTAKRISIDPTLSSHYQDTEQCIL